MLATSQLQVEQCLHRPVPQGRWEMPAQPVVSGGCRDLLGRVLVRDPAQRLSLDEVLGHPWFHEVSVRHFKPAALL
jgi:hypothetical protein